ncbi:hypothetical protein LCGC14_3017420, partial [marine sediment metagenome]
MASKEKEAIEGALEKKAKEIIERFTDYSGTNIYLHNRDPKWGHPKELGDYDVLAFIK